MGFLTKGINSRSPEIGMALLLAYYIELFDQETVFRDRRMGLDSFVGRTWGLQNQTEGLKSGYGKKQSAEQALLWGRLVVI